VTTIPAELDKPELYTGLAPDGIASISHGFAPHFIEFVQAKAEALAITPDQPKAARAKRLQLRAIRVAADKTRKSLKEDSLRRGKAIDGVYNWLEYQLAPIEEGLEEIEKAEERKEAARKDALKALRTEELAPYCDPQHYDLANMPEDGYQQLLAGVKAAKVERERQAAEAEAAKVAAAKAAAEAAAKAEAERKAEEARLRAENERLAAEKAESDRLAKIAADKAAAEKAAADALLAKERAAAAEAARVAQAAADAKLAAERAAADAERKRLADEAAKAKAEADRLAAVEAARVAEAKAKADAEAKAAREAAAAPERQKVVAFAAMLRGLAVPELQTEAGKVLAARIANNLVRLAAVCEEEAAKL